MGMRYNWIWVVDGMWIMTSTIMTTDTSTPSIMWIRGSRICYPLRFVLCLSMGNMWIWRIITDLNGNSVFSSSRTCDGAGTNTGSPDTTDVIVQTESTAESTSSTTDETTTTVVVELSGATKVHYRASLCVGSILLAVLFF